MNYHDRAKDLYEQAMEVIHSYVGDAVEATEELSSLIDELVNEQSRDRADELIDKILLSLEKIG